MHEFSHEELQQVIVRYDGQVKKLKAQKDDVAGQLARARAECQSIQEMLDIKTEEISGLKLHVQQFNQENAELKKRL